MGVRSNGRSLTQDNNPLKQRVLGRFPVSFYRLTYQGTIYPLVNVLHETLSKRVAATSNNLSTYLPMQLCVPLYTFTQYPVVVGVAGTYRATPGAG